MHHIHSFTLNALSRELSEIVVGGFINSVFTQNKDEIILEVVIKDEESLYIRISCHSKFQYIFPDYHFSRAKSNSLDLFKEIHNKTIIDIGTILYDRILYIVLDKYLVICKMYGNRSNVILQYENKIISQLRNNLSESPIQLNNDYSVLNYKEQLREFTYNQNEISFEVQKKLKQALPFFDNEFIDFLDQQLKQGNSIDRCFDQLIKLNSFCYSYVLNKRNDVKFSLLPISGAKRFELIIESLNVFIKSKLRYFRYITEFKLINDLISAQLTKLANHRNSIHKSINKLQRQPNYEEYGHLILAYIHQITKGSTSIKVLNYFNDQEIDIQLDPLLSSQQNASQYYQKQKEKNIKLAYLKKQIVEIEDQIGQINDLKSEVFLLENFKDLSSFKKKHQDILNIKNVNQSISLPFRSFSFLEYQIWIGKNAKCNDALTFKYSNKHDWWFHAKDVSGSHVVVKNPKKDQLPLAVIEHAASLAAYFSKQRNNPLVTVSYTERKYIRKTKKLPPGAVFVDRETTILVEPISPHEYEK